MSLYENIQVNIGFVFVVYVRVSAAQVVINIIILVFFSLVLGTILNELFYFHHKLKHQQLQTEKVLTQLQSTSENEACFMCDICYVIGRT